MFFDEVKKGSWHPDKILVSWNVGVYEIDQEVAVASFSFKNQGHDPEVWWLSSSPKGVAGAVAVVLAVGQLVILGSDVSSVCQS